MNPKDIIIDFQDKSKYNYCCSESIFYAANKYYDLDFNESTFKVSAAFCGGNLTEGNCGLLTASIAVIAAMFAKENSHSSPLMKEYIQEYTTVFTEKYSTDNCKKLKEIYREEASGCKSFIIDSFVTLTDFIDSKR